MNLIGEIVEHESTTPTVPVSAPTASLPSPAAFAKRRPSQWKSRLASRGLSSMSGVVSAPEGKQKSEAGGEPLISASDKDANTERVLKMSEEEKQETMESLLQSFNPETLKLFAQRAKGENKTAKDTEEKKGFELTPEIEARNVKILEKMTIEGDGAWIGGGKNGETVDQIDFKYAPEEAPKQLSSLNSVLKNTNSESSIASSGSGKKVRFNTEAYVKYEENQDTDDEWEDIADVKEVEDDRAPEFDEIQSLLVNKELNEHSDEACVHFPKPKQTDDELDINDPLFNTKLKEKYFPDLPSNPQALDWMKPLPEPPKEIIYDSISDLRFDFEGKIISNDMLHLPTTLGLHHHADRAELPGYTLAELERYARSTVSGQRCIAIRTLGRILYKLGTGTYRKVLVPEYDPDEVEDEEAKSPVEEIESRFWHLVRELRLVESLEMAADEQKTRNISVRNYAIEALWLWKQGGGESHVSTTE